MLAASLVSAALIVCFGPGLWRWAKIRAAVSRLDALAQDDLPLKPEHGGVVRCRNGKWVIVELHHGTLGFTLAYTSARDAYAETDYLPHPVIECWGKIIRGRQSDG